MMHPAAFMLFCGTVVATQRLDRLEHCNHLRLRRRRQGQPKGVATLSAHDFEERSFDSASRRLRRNCKSSGTLRSG